MSLPESPSAARPTPPSSYALPSLADIEELLNTLPGVISARVLESDGGSVGDVHVLTGAEVAPKQTVRNVESALLAHFGVRIDHRKISVATTTDAARVRAGRAPSMSAAAAPAQGGQDFGRRRIYFDDIETHRSSRGASCRVTLRKGDARYEGDAESSDGPRGRPEDAAARATVAALSRAEGGSLSLALEGVQVVRAFGRDFVFVGVVTRVGRGSSLLAGSCEVRDSVDEAAALAVLDATNRWIARGR